MAIYKINSSDLEDEYVLIAIHCNSEPYKLAFEINLKLKTKLKKSVLDISFKGDNSVFELYKHLSETYNTRLYLISNKSKNNTDHSVQSLFDNLSISTFLVPELKKADFLLKIEGGGFKIESLLKKLNEISSVVSSYTVSVNSDKSKYNLIFE